MLKITPRARKAAETLGLSPEQIRCEGTGFGGGICEADVFAFARALQAGKGQRATPLAKKIAAAAGVKLPDLAGSGSGGKILRRDVEAAAKAIERAPAATGAVSIPAPAAFNRRAGGGREIRKEIPYDGVRKIIGERMSQSKFTAPHLYFTQKVDMGPAIALREQVNDVQPQKVSLTDFIVRAAVLALQKFPEMNASLIGERIVQYKTVNLGVAVAAPGGLIVPVIKRAEQLRLAELASAGGRLFQKARDGKLTPEEYTGGTFTISNLGMFGIENFTAIINPPEAGILAVSAVKDEAVVAERSDGEKEIVIRPMMNIQLTVDHRLVDGLLAAQFSGEIKRLLEKPAALLV